MDLDTWIRQPSTITGLGIAGGALAGALAHMATGNHMIDAAAATVVLVLTHLGIDDNSAVARAAGKVSADAVAAIGGASPLPVVLDAAALVQAISAQAAPAPAPQTQATP